MKDSTFGWKKRYFVLGESFLEYHGSPQEAIAAGDNGQSSERINLLGCSVAAILGDKKVSDIVGIIQIDFCVQNKPSIEVQQGKKKWKFYSEVAAENDLW